MIIKRNGFVNAQKRCSVAFGAAAVRRFPKSVAARHGRGAKSMQNRGRGFCIAAVFFLCRIYAYGKAMQAALQIFPLFRLTNQKNQGYNKL
jgi:hypothetical protein